MKVPTLEADTVPCVETVCRAKAVTPPATWRSGLVASGTRSTKLVLMPLKPVVCALAMLPEMFCSANDCACRPPTEVLSASKIPITSSPNPCPARIEGTAVIRGDVAGAVPMEKIQLVQWHEANAPAARPG